MCSCPFTASDPNGTAESEFSVAFGGRNPCLFCVWWADGSIAPTRTRESPPPGHSAVCTA